MADASVEENPVGRVASYGMKAMRTPLIDLPFEAGYRTEGLLEEGSGDGGKTNIASTLLTYGGLGAVTGAALDSVLQSLVEVDALSRGEQFLGLGAVFVGLGGGSVLAGRAAAKWERYVTSELDALEDDYADTPIVPDEDVGYSTRFHSSGTEVPPLGPEEIEAYTWHEEF